MLQPTIIVDLISLNMQELNLLKKLVYILIFSMLCAWVIPAVAALIPEGCSCCQKVECCCGCKDGSSDTDAAEKRNEPPAKHCNCTAPEAANSVPYAATSTGIKSLSALLDCSLSKGTPVNCSRHIFTDNKKIHPPPHPLFLLKASFIL